MVRNGKRLKAWASKTARKKYAAYEAGRKLKIKRKRELKKIYEEAYQKEKGVQKAALARIRAKREVREGKWTMRARTVADIGGTLAEYDPIGFPKAQKGVDELGLGMMAAPRRKRKKRKVKRKARKRKVKRKRKKKR
jgi:hypothetical protein